MTNSEFSQLADNWRITGGPVGFKVRYFPPVRQFRQSLIGLATGSGGTDPAWIASSFPRSIDIPQTQHPRSLAVTAGPPLVNETRGLNYIPLQLQCITDRFASTCCNWKTMGTWIPPSDRISAPFHTSGPLAKPRPPSKRGFPAKCMGLPGKRPGWGWVGPESWPARDNRPAQPLHDAALKISERTSIGIPITHRTTRQDSGAVRQRVDRHVRCVAGHGRADSPATISESWRGMSL
jgi:hypothetical protein